MTEKESIEKLKAYSQLKVSFLENENIDRYIDNMNIDLVGVSKLLLEENIDSFIFIAHNLGVIKVVNLKFNIENIHLDVVFNDLSKFFVEIKNFSFILDKKVDENVVSFIQYFINLTQNKIFITNGEGYFSHLSYLANRIKTNKSLVFSNRKVFLGFNNDKVRELTTISLKRETKIDKIEIIKFMKGYFYDYFFKSFKLLRKFQIDIWMFDEVTKFLTDKDLKNIDLQLRFLKYNKMSFISLLNRRVKPKSIHITLVIMSKLLKNTDFLEAIRNGATVAFRKFSKLKFIKRLNIKKNIELNDFYNYLCLISPEF